MTEEIGMLIQPVVSICLAENIQTSKDKTTNTVLGLTDQEIFNSVFSLAVIGPGDHIRK